MDNVDSNQLSDLILSLNCNSGYPLPSRQEILLILNNPEMKSMFKYACNLIEKQKEIEKAKKILSFHSLYKDKITSLNFLRQKEANLRLKLKEKKDKLSQLQTKRASIESKNQLLLNQTKENDKKRKLAELKNKILNSSQMELSALLNKLNKMYFLENYKYPQSKSNIGLTEEEDYKDFDLNSYIEKTSGLITLNASILTQTDANNNKNTANQGIVQLPKLSRDELKQYIQLNQGEFWLQIKQSIEAIMNSSMREKDSLFDQTSLDNISTNVLNVEYPLICKSFLEVIQNEEAKLSIDYNENKKYDYHISVINDNISLIKAYKIQKEDLKKIASIARGRLAKDIMLYLSKRTSDFNSLNKEEEFIIPQCIINDNLNELISYERNILKTYNKYKQRTDAFITKRILPLSDLLEEKYTDFTNTIRIEIDYFNKLKLNHFKRDIGYSLGKFKYDKDVLLSFRVNSKYDLFSFYFKYMDMLIKDKINNEKNKTTVDSIYKNKSFNEYSGKSKLLSEVDQFNKSFNFDQKYHLFSDDRGVSTFNSIVETWGDIDYMNYDIEVNELKNRFR